MAKAKSNPTRFKCAKCDFNTNHKGNVKRHFGSAHPNDHFDYENQVSVVKAGPTKGKTGRPKKVPEKKEVRSEPKKVEEKKEVKTKRIVKRSPKVEAAIRDLSKPARGPRIRTVYLCAECTAEFSSKEERSRHQCVDQGIPMERDFGIPIGNFQLSSRKNSTLNLTYRNGQRQRWTK